MAHKNLVGGTAYDTKGGKCKAGGTGYSIKKGRTLVGGTGYDISFQGDVEVYTVSINKRGIGTPDSSGDICCAVVDGTVYNNASLGAYDDGPVLTVPFGTLITCYVRSENYSTYHIEKDDEYVTTRGDSNKKVLSYSFYVTADTVIKLTHRTASLGDSYEACWIEITTS